MKRSKFTEKEAFNGQLLKFKSHRMGMQVSCFVDTKVPEKEVIWEITRTSWCITKGPRKAEGE